MREGGDFNRAVPLLREAIVLAQRHRMQRLEGLASAWIAMGSFLQGEDELTMGDFERAASLLEATDNGFVLANLYAISAIARASLGDDEGCERDLVALDTLALEMDDALSRLNQTIGHGLVALFRGDAPQAVAQLGMFANTQGGAGMIGALLAFLALAEALNGQLDDAEVHVSIADTTSTDAVGLLRTTVAIVRAEIAYQRGDHAAAWDAAIAAATATAARSVMTSVLVGVVGRSAFHLRRPEEAVRVIAAAIEGTRADEPTLPGLWTVVIGDCIDQCRAELGDDAFDALWAEGARLSFVEALALVQRGRGSRQRPMVGWDSLTPTEADVARLVAQGAANKEVAAQLFMSEATVKTHLTRIYAKVGLKNRAQLAAAHRSS
jgi:DNA-binding CsgD family transcriptional regulator